MPDLIETNGHVDYDNPSYVYHYNDEINSVKLTQAKLAVKLSNVSFSYGKNQMIHNFNMQVETSSIYCLIGSSGAGKNQYNKFFFISILIFNY